MITSPLFLLGFAALFNIVSVICLKLCKEFTRPLPALGAVAFIVMTQWLVTIALARGGQLGIAITAVAVATMLGAAIAGPLLGDPRPTVLQCLGYAIAIGGVFMASAKI